MNKLKRFNYMADADVRNHLYLKEDHLVAEVGEFHNSVEFIFVKEGRIKAYLHDKECELDEGCIFFADSYEIHHYEPLSEEIKVYTVVLGGEYTEEFCNLYPHMKCPTFMTDKEKNKVVFQLVSRWLAESNKSRLKNHGYVNLLFACLMDVYPLEEKDDKQDGVAVFSMLVYINEHYTEKLTLEKLAKVCGYSVGYCSQQIKQAVGCGFTDYVNMLRFVKTRELLANTTKRYTTLEALYKAGFNSPVTYYRVKKKFS